MTWESDLVASLSSLSSTEKIQRLLNELEVVDGKRYLFLMGLFEKMIAEMPFITAAKLLAMTIRDLNSPDLLALISKTIFLKDLHVLSPGDSHPLTYLVNALPQILPYILSDLVRAVNKTPSLMKPILPFLAFVVSMDWTSPLSDSREIIESLVILRGSCAPVELAALLSECIKRIELDGYSPVNTINLAMSKIASCFGIKGSESAFMLCVDSLIVFCKKNEENILPLLLDLAANVPENLAPFYSCLMCLFLKQEPSSVSLANEVLSEAHRLCSRNPWIGHVKLYLGLSREISSLDFSKVYSPTDLVQYFESDELRVLTKYLEIGSIPFTNDDTFSSTLSLLHSTQSMLSGSLDISKFFTDTIPNEKYHDEIRLLLVLCFKKRPGQFKTLLRILISFGSTSESNKTFALGLITTFLRMPRLRLVALPVLCNELKDHAYLFSSIQATLPILLTSSAPSSQLHFAICVRNIVDADSRQGHLNFAFTCVKEFFKAKNQCIEAVGLMLEVLDALCSIRYIDPKVVWNNIVMVHVIHLVEKNPFIRALCCPLASKAILSYNLSLDEPVPEEVKALFKSITESLFATRDEMVFESASNVLLKIDQLMFPETFPTSHALVEFMQRIECNVKDDSKFVMLLKKLLDKEISDMPRSLFLGTSNRTSKAESNDINDGLMQTLRDKTASEWSNSPYMLEPYMRLELLTLNSEISAEKAESILADLLKLPSLMQLHWSTRLVLLDHLTKLFTELVTHLNAHGHLNAVAARFKDRYVAHAKSGSSPAQVACGLICRTALELALSEVHKDSRFVGWAKELKEMKDLKGKYDRSEEVEAAVLLCLWKIHKVHPVLDSAMFKTGTTWLSVLSSIISKDTGLALHSDDQLVNALGSSPAVAFNIDDLKALSKKAKLSPSEFQHAQAQIVSAAKFDHPTEEILETCMSLHSALLMGEPADLKNLTSIYISRICHRLAVDEAEVWLKYLTGKLEKPAPAIVKYDAAIALTELLFGGTADLLERVPSSFFGKILPTLISASTDSRVSSCYINLMACKFGATTGPSSPITEATENRFGKEWAFGQILASLSTTKTAIKSSNQLKVLTALKILPRFEWDQLLSRFNMDSIIKFILAHVVTQLSTGGTYISPGLLRLLKLNIASITGDLVYKLGDVIPFLELADHEFIVKSLLESSRGANLLPAFELFSQIYSGRLEKPEFFDQMALELLSDPSHVPTSEVYKVAASFVDLEQSSVVCTFLQLLKSDWDLKRIVSLIRLPALYRYGFLDMITEEVSGLPEGLRTDLLVKILELALIESDLEVAMYELFTRLVLNWLDPVHRELFNDDHMGVVWRAYEEMNVEFEDWRRLGKRFAQLGPQWDSFKRHPSLLSHILNL